MAGAAHGPSAHPEWFARRDSLNHRAMYLLFALLLFLVVVFVVLRVARLVARLCRGETTKSSILVTLSRKVRGAALRKVSGFPSAGHALVVILYLAINIVVTFTNLDNTHMTLHSNLAARTGALAMANLVIVVIFGLKNTPLAPVLARSYEGLNVLHRVAGYTTLVLVVIHASLYSSYFAGQGRPERLLERNDIFGIVAGLAFLILAFAGGVIRRWSYELFYYIHVGFWIVAIVTTALHQPKIRDKLVYAPIASAAIWGLDRLVRMTRLAVYSINNSATLTPLSNGGTRVTLLKPPMGAVAGEHCFLWIPSIRLCETHPFTIAGKGPLEFVVASYDGFTRDLHKYAVGNPGVSLRASVEGPYGAIPNAASYDKVVLVAGGSGASFTFGMALNMLEKIGDKKKRIVFVWIVRYESYLAWFGRHLQTLTSDGRVTVRLFVTKEPQTKTGGEIVVPPMFRGADADSPENHAPLEAYVVSEKAWPQVVDVTSDTESRSTATLSPVCSRPDIGLLLVDEIAETPRNERVLILGCGPDGLMSEVRNAAAKGVQADGASVELHCEQFGW